MKRLRTTALLLMLTAGSLALPCAAQQEVMPDIYDATARSSMPAAAKTKMAVAKPSAVKKVARKHTQHKSSGVMLASARTPKAAAK
jgi:hypothetical protein